MKIRCDQLLNEHTSQESTNDPWLTIGKTYTVLSIYISQDTSIKYRILADDGSTPALHAAQQFEVVDSSLPPCWIANVLPYTFFELTPKEWSETGFWTKFFDGEPEARAVFDRICRDLLA